MVLIVPIYSIILSYEGGIQFLKGCTHVAYDEEQRCFRGGMCSWRRPTGFERLERLWVVLIRETVRGIRG